MVGKGTYRTKEEKARIVMEVLSSSSTIAEICRKYNVASSAVYKWRDEFIAGGTAAMEHGRSTVEASLSKEINELKGIIGELTIANETLKKFNLQGEVGSHDGAYGQWLFKIQISFPNGHCQIHDLLLAQGERTAIRC